MKTNSQNLLLYTDKDFIATYMKKHKLKKIKIHGIKTHFQ